MRKDEEMETVWDIKGCKYGGPPKEAGEQTQTDILHFHLIHASTKVSCYVTNIWEECDFLPLVNVGKSEL